jgi:orotidine-5'-phosphate decarboxylase
MYAKAFFENLSFDSVTVAPYMGVDSVSPFLEFDNKWVVLLGLTSNEGGKDFQYLELKAGGNLYEEVLRKSTTWATEDCLMYVVGATRADALENIRKIIPNHFLLVPGVGAQGGSLEEVSKYGMNSSCGLLVNSSRGIIYASVQEDFAQVAGLKAKELQSEMSNYLDKYL